MKYCGSVDRTDVWANIRSVCVDAKTRCRVYAFGSVREMGGGQYSVFGGNRRIFKCSANAWTNEGKNRTAGFDNGITVPGGDAAFRDHWCRAAAVGGGGTR